MSLFPEHILPWPEIKIKACFEGFSKDSRTAATRLWRGLEMEGVQKIRNRGNYPSGICALKPGGFDANVVQWMSLSLAFIMPWTDAKGNSGRL